MDELKSLMTIIGAAVEVLDSKLVFLIDSSTRKVEDVAPGHKRVYLDSFGFMKIENIVGTHYMYNSLKEILGIDVSDDHVKIERIYEPNRLIFDIYF